jgi:hypothetical protein
MATPEGKVKAKVKKILTDMGVEWCMPMGTGYGHAGVGDFVGCYLGRYVEIECKAGENEPTKLQWARLNRVMRAGGIALVINELNVSQLEEYLTNGTINFRKNS